MTKQEQFAAFLKHLDEILAQTQNGGDNNDAATSSK